MTHATNETVSELIVRHLEPDPAYPGLAEWRLKERSVPVWAIIGTLSASLDNAGFVATEYGVSTEAVAAAIEFYHEHRSLIDARLAANAA